MGGLFGRVGRELPGITVWAVVPAPLFRFGRSGLSSTAFRFMPRRKEEDRGIRCFGVIVDGVENRKHLGGCRGIVISKVL